MGADMGFRIEHSAGGVVVRVTDTRLDAAQAIRFKDGLREIVARHGPVIVLDLGAVDFMDSSGLGAILSIRRTLPSTHRLELAALTPNVRRVFRLTHMDTVFTIHDAAPATQPLPCEEAGGPGAARPQRGMQ